MNDFFGFTSYHILMTITGGALLLSLWLPVRLFPRPPAGSALLMLAGLLAALVFPGATAFLDPSENPKIWEITTEIVVIVVLFATGLRIDDPGSLRTWRSTIGLLAITMPLTIAAVAFLGVWLAGLTLAGALVLGAVLAPTDPVLAGDVQIGPPLEGREHPVRFTLTTEAGLNDGLAFPFVYLAIHVAMAPEGGWLLDWALLDVLYRIVVGAVIGAGIGWIVARLLFSGMENKRLADAGPGSLALGAVLLGYGASELVEGYGFIAAFVAGFVCRRGEAEHRIHRKLHDFSDSIEQAATAILLVLLGSLMPLLWSELDWRHSLIGFGLLLVIRPLAGWLGLLGSGLKGGARWLTAFYGVRGIGSVYYLAYASGHIEFANDRALWALVVHVIFASTVIHGLTARSAVRRILPE
ncbi:sodium:proton antiporter [Oceanicola sp. 22II-s10i]|uniref:cation:proton antiporter n=1 Tax=Oceanicola sp. 22II-s10i TaxID=1317116 RepID=UPI000B5283A9|nr:cation:proton antiporter [Oceanicola sp. 22II-s10i]OWU84752.1 sodium:proton antiporter [Oceanicola sp. 22II-s10i]